MAEDIDINVNINVNGVEDLEALKESLDDLQGSADNASNSLSEEANAEEEASQGASDLADSTNEASIASDALSSIVSGLVSVGLADYFKTSAEAFDNYNLSMSAMSTVAENNNVSLSNMTDGVKAVTDATSLSGGVTREFFNNMVNMGVTNTKALSDTMIGLQGSTVITGGSFDSMKGKLIMMMNSTSLQTRALTGMGLSVQKLAQVNGMSVDELKSKWESFTPDQKLEVLNKGLSENKGLTEQLSQTSGDKLKEIENSWGALSIAIGSSTSGATNAIYDLTNNGINGLTWAIKNIPFMDTFAGLGLGASSALMSISPLFTTFNQLSMAIGNAKKVTDLLTLSNIKETASNVAGKIANTARTAVDTMRAGAQWLLNDSLIAGAFAEYTFLAPMLLIIGAIAGVIAGIYLLGQYMGWWNDWGGFIDAVKARIMDIWNAIVKFAQYVVVGVQTIIDKWNSFKKAVNNVMIYIRTIIFTIWTNITARINGFVRSIIDGVVNGFNGLVSKVRSVLSGIYNAIASPFQKAYNTVKPIIDAIKSGADAIGGAVSWLTGGSGSFESSVSSAGFTTGGSLGNIMNNNASSSTVVNINGIIENDAKEYIVNAVNDRVKKENLITGVI